MANSGLEGKVVRIRKVRSKLKIRIMNYHDNHDDLRSNVVNDIYTPVPKRGVG
jgi:hypothetical protein